MEKKLSLSQQIAEIGAGLKFEDLPERVVNNSKMFIMDLLGNIIASRHVDSSLTCLKAVRELVILFPLPLAATTRRRLRWPL